MSVFHGGSSLRPLNTWRIYNQIPHAAFIYVDKDGRRFANETGSEIHEVSKMVMSYAPHRSNYPHLPAYAIFDDLTVGRDLERDCIRRQRL